MVKDISEAIASGISTRAMDISGTRAMTRATRTRVRARDIRARNTRTKASTQNIRAKTKARGIMATLEI